MLAQEDRSQRSSTITWYLQCSPTISRSVLRAHLLKRHTFPERMLAASRLLMLQSKLCLLWGESTQGMMARVDVDLMMADVWTRMNRPSIA
jgi:hypothetical protein